MGLELRALRVGGGGVLKSGSVRYLIRVSSFVVVRSRLRVVPHFSSGIVERAKRERA